MAELNTLSPLKWEQDFSGAAPTIDTTDGVKNGDIAIDTSDTTLMWVCMDNTDSAPVWGRILVESASQELVLDKATKRGIKVDIASPTHGWHDLLGDIKIHNPGGDDPIYSTYRDGIRAYEFNNVGDEVFIEFHLPHDYLEGSDLYIHTHWSHHNASPLSTGALTWDFETTYAKGHDQAAFPATVTPTVTHDAAASNVPQYQHMISEVQLSATSPSGTQLDSDDIEIDGLILVRVELSANTTADNPFLHFVDIHYQSTGIPSKEKAPDFYA